MMVFDRIVDPRLEPSVLELLRAGRQLTALEIQRLVRDAHPARWRDTIWQKEVQKRLCDRLAREGLAKTTGTTPAGTRIWVAGPKLQTTGT